MLTPTPSSLRSTFTTGWRTFTMLVTRMIWWRWTAPEEEGGRETDWPKFMRIRASS